MTEDEFTVACSSHARWLQHWFLRRGIDRATSDDLVQETLVEAWRRSDQVYDASGIRSWLGAIARNILLRWRRDVGRHWHRLAHMDDREGVPLPAVPDADTGNPLDAVVRQEISLLLGEALRGLLPADRDLLLARYGKDQSLAMIGARYHLPAAHAAVRLQRARHRLRAVLESLDAAERATLGVATTSTPWRSTRLWCPHCGADHLRMELDSRQGAFALACPSCCTGPGHYLYNWRLVDADQDTNPLRSARTPAEALDRTVHRSAWDLPRRGEQRHCPACAGPVRIRARFPDEAPRDLAHLQLVMSCPACGPLDASATFGGMATFHPDGLAFWRAMGRVQTRPPVLARFDQRDAVRVDLVSVGTAEARVFFIDASGERLLAVVADA